MNKYLLFFFTLVISLCTSSLNAQNISPLAVVSGSNCSTGPCSSFNDLNFLTCGTQQVWVSTASPPSATPGVDWVQWDWSSVQSFNEIIIHHANAAARFLTGALIQTWNGSAWVNHHTFTNLPMQCISIIPIPMATTARMRITAFQMTGTGQTSNPNFREIEIIGSANCSGTPNAGLVSFTGTDTVICGNSKVFTLANQTGGLGITYRWQKSINNGVTWVAFDSNVTTTTLSNIVVPTLVRNSIHCANSNITSFSNVVKMNVSSYQFSLGGDTVICDNTSIDLTTASYAPDSVIWDNNTTGVSRSVNQPGTYYARITLANGCKASDTIIIADGVEPVNPILPTYNLCEGTSFQLNALNPGMTYLWSNNATNAIITVSQPGSYNVTITSEDLCKHTFNTLVTARPNPIIVLPADLTICSTDSILVDGTAVHGNTIIGYNVFNRTIKVENKTFLFMALKF